MLDKQEYAAAIGRHGSLASGHEPLMASLYSDDVTMNVSAPVGSLAGAKAVHDGLWGPLLSALPDMERRTDILSSGLFNGARWFASSGYFVGHFQHPLWSIAPTGRPLWLRYGWFDRIEDNHIVESYVIFDVVRLLMDAGQWPLAPQLGDTRSPAPRPQDGMAVGQAGGQASLDLVEAMIAGLMRFDGKSLGSMGMVDFWTPQFQWYGPGGIGSARGHADYERTHQRPFLTAFPDRIGGNHKCRIGDGSYVASTGWPSINATHSGDGWLGLPATGKRVTMKVMDFWRRDEELLSENWVFIDMIDLLGQIGVDVFKRLNDLHGDRPG